MDSEARREQHFVEELKKWHSKNKRVLITRDEYFETVNELITSQETKVKSPRQYYLIKKYELLNCGDTQKLIRKRKDENSEPVYFVFIEETFSILKRAHILTGHGGRDKMIKNLSQKYANITQESINLFKAGCIECQKKKRRPTTKGTVVRPILTKEFGTRSQVDLIDMQSMKGRFSWIMVYQDHLTKFIVLRPLTSKRAAEVAYQLLDIFLLFGAPQILQSDNGSEFTAQVIEELKLLWPSLIMVHGKPRHPQSQGSVERANADIKDMLTAWLADNETTDWTVGLKFVQFYKNSSFHSGIKRTPFAALFGSDAKIGLTTSSLPHEIISRLEKEEDLLNLFVVNMQLFCFPPPIFQSVLCLSRSPSVYVYFSTSVCASVSLYIFNLI